MGLPTNPTDDQEETLGTGRKLGYDAGLGIWKNNQGVTTPAAPNPSPTSLAYYANEAAFPSTATAGSLAYNQENNLMYFYNGDAWRRMDVVSQRNILLAAPGGILFTTTGVFNWTVPLGVTSIDVVAVGGGGGGFGYWNVDATELRIGTGGTGGDLSWKNDILVTPGETLEVSIGAGGTRGNQSGGAYGNVNYSAQPGGSTYIKRGNTTLILAKGGNAPGNNNTDVSVRDGGGAGGAGGPHGSIVTGGGGGGGAGGYSGAGGSGGTNTFNPWTPTGPGGNGSGGGGSGGRGAGGQSSTGTNGGGVGLYGEGPSGTGGSGQGGSLQHGGGEYGAGGGAGKTSNSGEDGGMRVIWGTNRDFPTTNVTTDYSTVETEI